MESRYRQQIIHCTMRQVDGEIVFIYLVSLSNALCLYIYRPRVYYGYVIRLVTMHMATLCWFLVSMRGFTYLLCMLQK